MRVTSGTTFMLVAMLFLGAGCAGNASAPAKLTSPRGLNAAVPVQVHGVLHVPSPLSAGVQGRVTPWLLGDNDSAYDLVLGPGFEPLSDPAFSGRGVTINGDITVEFPAPVGAEPFVLRVTAFSFD